jgi:lipoprotein NlpD
VEPGDTLYKIAFEQGLDYRDLATWNSLADPDRIRVGEILRLSSRAPLQQPVATVVATRPLAAPVPVVESRPMARPASSTAAPIAAIPSGQREERPAARPAIVQVSTVPPAVHPAPEPVPPGNGEAVSDTWSWPARGTLLARFGEGLNKGIDIAGPRGAPVHAAAPGRVVYAGSGLRGYGKLIIIRHGKTLLSAYAHNARILVTEGQYVARGQAVGEIGDSDADRVKLHFEIREQGKPVDPLDYLPNAG